MKPGNKAAPTPVTPETARGFARLADPHHWLMTADNLHEQAIKMRHSSTGELLIRRDPNGREARWDVTERATILLASFAIENAIKAFLVYENPEWVSGGRLSKQLRSHQLVSLRAKSNLIPYRNRYTGVLRFLENGIESWARYPCALTAEDSVDMPNLTDEIWQEYCRLMVAYGKKMTTLLRAGWNGPHGSGGTWETTMEFLQQTRDSRAASRPSRKNAKIPAVFRV